jgi:ABC-type hemin transport system ATPase subunit
MTVPHDVCIEIHVGETVALFGSDGAGKTTLLNATIGELRLSSVKDNLLISMTGPAPQREKARRATG